MARAYFDKQLSQLNTELLTMGALVEQAIEGAVRALEAGDLRLAREVVDADHRINQQERDIESLCLKLLLRQQPVARDLRTVSAALKMITDIERIGDQAANICQIVLETEHRVDGSHCHPEQSRAVAQREDPRETHELPPSATSSSVAPVAHLIPLARATTHMVSSAIDAFVARDVAQAHEVIASDERVDALFATVKDELLAWLRSTSDPSSDAIDLLLIAKYFERIGDHAQNIAEWVEYSLTGIHKGVRLT